MVMKIPMAIWTGVDKYSPIQDNRELHALIRKALALSALVKLLQMERADRANHLASPEADGAAGSIESLAKTMGMLAEEECRNAWSSLHRLGVRIRRESAGGVSNRYYYAEPGEEERELPPFSITREVDRTMEEYAAAICSHSGWAAILHG